MWWSLILIEVIYFIFVIVFNIYIYIKWKFFFISELMPSSVNCILSFFVLFYVCSVLLLPFTFNFVRANLRIFLLHHYNLFRYASSSSSYFFFVFFSFLILLTIFYIFSYSSSSSRNCSKFDEPFSLKWTYKLYILYFNCGSVASTCCMHGMCANECVLF